MGEDASWITVGALAHAFSEESYAPRPTAELAGKSLVLHLEDGGTLAYRFETGTELSWSAVATGAASSPAPGAEAAGPATPATPATSDAAAAAGAAAGQPPVSGPASLRTPYLAVALRPGIYFVDHLDTGARATTITLLLDLERGIATVLTGTLPETAEARQPLAERIAAGKELTAVDAVFAAASLDAPFTGDTPRHRPSTAMVGRRVEYTYSPTERYEHIYLNDRFYTWHCLLGSEKGLADTDRCHYLAVDDDLFLFVWREKIVPTLGVVAVDFREMRTTGKIFGYQGEGGEQLANFPVGARARLLNVTTRD